MHVCCYIPNSIILQDILLLIVNTSFLKHKVYNYYQNQFSFFIINKIAGTNPIHSSLYFNKNAKEE